MWKFSNFSFYQGQLNSDYNYSSQSGLSQQQVNDLFAVFSQYNPGNMKKKRKFKSYFFWNFINFISLHQNNPDGILYRQEFADLYYTLAPDESLEFEQMLFIFIFLNLLFLS